jgi:hypothetical protein
MTKLGSIIAALVLSLGFSATAHARVMEYVSQHPVPHKYGGGFCTIDVPHVHNYGPSDPRMYRENHGQYYFVGDPAPFDYDGPRYAYYGAHPVVDAQVQFGHPIYCYIKGPHYHWYQPPPQAQFQMSGGAYWYVGSFPQAYYDERPRYAVINEAYAPMPYARPVVDVQVAPPVVAAEISFGGPGWRGAAVLGGPAVYVAPPSPAVQVGLGINIGGPSVMVGPGPVFVGGPTYVEDRRYHHDHGRHEGWRHEGWRHDPGPRFHGPAPARYAPMRAPVDRPLFRGGPGRPASHFSPAPAPRRGSAPGRPAPFHESGRGH